MRIFLGLDLLLSFIASCLRLGAGGAGRTASQEEPVILYEFEGCPYCRIAREAVSQSGVTALVRPCPKGGKRFRPAVKAQGGKAQFPYLVDPNTGVRMYESGAIAAYLHKTYGGRRSWRRFLFLFDQLLSQFAVLVRLAAGTFVKKSRAPEQPLEFYGAERDPAARLVKERLCEMEIEYFWRPHRSEEPTPRLFDPNTNETVTGAYDIRRYLKAVYRP